VAFPLTPTLSLRERVGVRGKNKIKLNFKQQLLEFPNLSPLLGERARVRGKL